MRLQIGNHVIQVMLHLSFYLHISFLQDKVSLEDNLGDIFNITQGSQESNYS